MPWKAAAKQGSSSGFSVRGLPHTCRPGASTTLEAFRLKHITCSNHGSCQLCVGLPHLLSGADLLEPVEVDILSIEIDDMLFPGLPARGLGLHLQSRRLNAA